MIAIIWKPVPQHTTLIMVISSPSSLNSTRSTPTTWLNLSVLGRAEGLRAKGFTRDSQTGHRISRTAHRIRFRLTPAFRRALPSSFGWGCPSPLCILSSSRFCRSVGSSWSESSISSISSSKSSPILGSKVPISRSVSTSFMFWTVVLALRAMGSSCSSPGIRRRLVAATG